MPPKLINTPYLTLKAYLQEFRQMLIYHPLLHPCIHGQIEESNFRHKSFACCLCFTIFSQMCFMPFLCGGWPVGNAFTMQKNILLLTFLLIWFNNYLFLHHNCIQYDVIIFSTNKLRKVGGGEGGSRDKTKWIGGKHR